MNIIIIGASGHAKVAYSIAKKIHYNVIQFVDDLNMDNQYLYDIPVSHDMLDLPINDEIIYFIAIGDNFKRHIIHEKLITANPNTNFATLIHPSSIVDESVSIGEGSILMPGCVINIGSVIGSHCIINTNSNIDHDCKIGNFSSVQPGVSIAGNVTIGSLSSICIGSNVIEKIKIGTNSVIGAHSLVNKDVDDYSLVYGSPSKKIKSIQFGYSYLK